MVIQRPFRPLLSFVSLATLPFSALPVTGAGGGGAPPVNTAPATMPVEEPREDRHKIAPAIEAAILAPDEDLSPYAQMPRYRVLGNDVAGNLWVSMNAPSDELPPPPDRRSGPIDCSCPNVDGHAGPRYGTTQEDGWRFGPHWLDETRPGMPFIPDLFRGAGPCFARDYTGLLQQWDDEWLVEKNGQQCLSDEVAAYFEYCDSIDKSVLAALDLREAADSAAPPGPAPTGDEIKRRWDRFVGTTQERRGRIAERLVRGSRWVAFRESHPELWYDVQWSGLFNYAPVGVWVRDTPARVKTIMQYIEDGVPVYYSWKPEFWKPESLSALRPYFAYTPQTPPGPPPKRPVETPSGASLAGNEGDSSPRGGAADSSGDFPDEQPDEFWEQASRQIDLERVEERAAARSRLRSPPPPLLPSSPRVTAALATGANRIPVAVPADRPTTTNSSEGISSSAPPAPTSRAEDKTAGELYTLVPPPLLLRLNPARPSGGRLQRIVSEAMKTGDEDNALGSEPVLREGDAASDGAPALAKRMLPRRELPRLFVYDILSVKMKIHSFLMNRQSPTDVFRLMQFLVGANIQYVSGVKVPKENVDQDKWKRVVRQELWISPSNPHYVVYQRWRRNLSEELNTPRIARAVPARGGLLARLAKYDGSILDLWREPTPEVYAHGSPRSVTHDGETYYGDWLSEDEARVFIGASGPAGPGSSSIFPPVDIFDKFYDGFWSSTWEQWFCQRIDEVRKGTAGTKAMYTAHEWERKLKGSIVH